MPRKSALTGRQFKYIKGSMHVLSFFVATLGLCLFAVGVWLKMDFSEDRYREVVDPAFWLCRQVDDAFDFHIDVQMDSMAYFFIFLGVAIFGIGGIGACGTARERQTYLLMFAILLYIVFGLLLTSGLQALEKKDSFVRCEQNVTSGLERAVLEYDTVPYQQDFMDRVQTHVRCCGATRGFADYLVPPFSCLKNATDTNSTDYYDVPCDFAIRSFFNSISSNMITILVVSAALGLFTIVGIGMSGYLFISLRHAKVL